MMKKYFYVVILVFIQGIIYSQSQAGQNSVKTSTGSKSISRADAGMATDKKVDVVKDAPVSTTMSATKSAERVTQPSTGFPKPATRTNSSVVVSKIEYKLDNSKTKLQNLLFLKDYREHVLSSNSSLSNTPEYTTLNSDIATLKNDFYQEVDSKGFLNLDSFEQSHYLAMLKEDGDFAKYSAMLALLNK